MPTKSAIWLPLRMRLKMSRPRLSVPMMCAADGGENMAGTLILNGSYGVIQSANSPQKTTSATSARPRRPRGSLRMRRSRRAPEVVGSTATERPMMATSDGGADTGIQPGDDEVGHDRRKDVDANGHQHRALQDRVVAQLGAVDDQAANSRADEDALCEHRAREQPPDGERQERQRRQY